MNTIDNLPALPLAHIMESDRVICECCLEQHIDDKHPYDMDNDPNWWISSTRPWEGSDECDSCGSRTGYPQD